MNVMAEAQRPLQAVMVTAGICPPFPPSSIIWFLTVVMKHDCISRTNYLHCQQTNSAQGSTHCHMNNTSMLMWSAIKNLTILYIDDFYSS